MLLRHVEGNSPVQRRIDPGKLKWGLGNCTWAILQGGEGKLCAAEFAFVLSNVLPYFTGPSKD